MNKTAIEWCDYTWNAVTGCLHGCTYCYARRIAERFGPQGIEWELMKECNPDDLHDIDEPVFDELRTYGFPFRFEPTIHRHRLAEPKHLRKPSRIFVSSMGDLFGDWVPDEWLDAVTQAMMDAPQHTYIMLTKNPKRMAAYFTAIRDNTPGTFDRIFKSRAYQSLPSCHHSRYVDMRKGIMPKNWWLGVTCENQQAANERIPLLLQVPAAVRFVSVEPILGPMNLRQHISGVDGMVNLQWVIIGAPGAVAPESSWVTALHDCVVSHAVPLFLKDNLRWPVVIQEWPEGDVSA